VVRDDCKEQYPRLAPEATFKKAKRQTKKTD
jgi:hypothetical protein